MNIRRTWILVALVACTLNRLPTALAQDKEDAYSPAAAKALSGGIDLFVERMVQKGKDADDQDWAVATNIYEGLAKKGRKLTPLDLPHFDFRAAPVLQAHIVNDLRPVPKRVICDLALAIAFGESFILCRGPAETANDACGECVVFVNGRMKTSASIGSSIVVCSGDVDVGGSVGQSIIICRGNLRIEGSVTGALLRSANIHLPNGFIQNSLVATTQNTNVFGFVEKSTLLAGGSVKCGTIRPGSVTREQEKSLPRLIEFFEIESTGIRFLHDGARSFIVADIEPDGPFARAGVHKGDQLVAIGAASFDSLDGLRGALRQKVTEGAGVFSVRRGERTLELNVRFRKRAG